MPKNLPPSLFIRCECSAESLELSFDEQDKEYYLSIWFKGFRRPNLPWRERLRFIWRILTHGNIWNDFIIVNRLDAQKIVDYINLVESEQPKNEIHN